MLYPSVEQQTTCRGVWAALTACALPAQLRTVPDRLKALQNHWPTGGFQDQMTNVLILIAAAALMAGLIIFLYRSLQSKRNAENACHGQAKKLGLTEEEYALLTRMQQSRNMGTKLQLLTSWVRFDAAVSAYLNRPGALGLESVSIITMLSSIRSKLFKHLSWTRTQSQSPPMSLADAMTKEALSFPRPGKIPLLSRIKAVCLTTARREAIMGHVIQRQPGRLRILSSKQSLQEPWKSGDLLSMRIIIEEMGNVELLAEVRNAAFQDKGIFLLDFMILFAPSLGGEGGGKKENAPPPLRQIITLESEGEKTKEALLESISEEGARLLVKDRVPLDRVIDLDIDFEAFDVRERIPGVVTYCCRMERGLSEIDVQFRDLGERALGFIKGLNAQKQAEVEGLEIMKKSAAHTQVSPS
jgi:hypothetical protein